MEKLENGIVKHLKRHALDGRWIHQRELRNSLHAKSAEAFNRAAIQLAGAGIVELDFEGPHRKKVIRLSDGKKDCVPLVIKDDNNGRAIRYRQTHYS